MAGWMDLIKDKGPEIAQFAISLIGGATGGLGVTKLALKKQRRVLANMQRPIMVIGTEGNDMVAQTKLLEKVDLFNVTHSKDDKASDHLEDKHRLLVLGYAENDHFHKAFGKAQIRNTPILVFAKPESIKKDDLTKITGYTFAALCNTDLRLVSDVFAVMSTFPEK